MRITRAGHAAILVAALLLLPRAAAAQRPTPSYDWSAPTVQATDSSRRSPVEVTPSAAAAAALRPQVIPERSPTPFVVGGAAIGAFAGGVIGYAGCLGTDGDCSFLVRLAAGTVLGSLLGALFWLGSVPQP